MLNTPLLFALLAPLTSALGNAIVSNRCPYDIWVWSVDASSTSSAILVPARSKHSEPLRTTSGTSLKISRTSALVNGKHTQFEYSIAAAKLWYNISFVNCAQGESAAACPGHEMGLAVDSPDGSCSRAECRGGSYCPTQAYYVDQPKIKMGVEEPVFGCGTPGAEMDLYMKVCSDEAELKRSIAGRVEVVEG